MGKAIAIPGKEVCGHKQDSSNTEGGLIVDYRWLASDAGDVDTGHFQQRQAYAANRHTTPSLI